MKLIDTHAHLNFSQFEEDKEEVIDRAKQEGLKYIVNVGTNIAASRRVLELSREDKYYMQPWVYIPMMPVS